MVAGVGHDHYDGQDNEHHEVWHRCGCCWKDILAVLLQEHTFWHRLHTTSKRKTAEQTLVIQLAMTRKGYAEKITRRRTRNLTLLTITLAETKKKTP